VSFPESAYAGAIIEAKRGWDTTRLSTLVLSVLVPVFMLEARSRPVSPLSVSVMCRCLASLVLSFTDGAGVVPINLMASVSPRGGSVDDVDSAHSGDLPSGHGRGPR